LHLIWNAVGTVRFQFTMACDLNAKSKVHVRSEGVKQVSFEEVSCFLTNPILAVLLGRKSLTSSAFCGLTKVLQVKVLLVLFNVDNGCYIQFHIYNLRYFL